MLILWLFTNLSVDIPFFFTVFPPPPHPLCTEKKIRMMFGAVIFLWRRLSRNFCILHMIRKLRYFSLNSSVCTLVHSLCTLMVSLLLNEIFIYQAKKRELWYQIICNIVTTLFIGFEFYQNSIWLRVGVQIDCFGLNLFYISAR